MARSANAQVRKSAEWILCRCALWLVFFALYAATTARDVLPADSGEFQLVAAKWGIAHPPGYPLYTIVGALWVRLVPLGPVPFRLNLFSAALAATTLLLTAEAVRTWATAWGAKPRAAWTGGLAAALLLGSAATFWAQATIANIRMPTMLFAAWGLLALAHERAAGNDARRRRAALLELALALGLGVGHHPSLAFVALGWALYLLLIDPKLVMQPSQWWKAALVAALAWSLPQLYLPLRGSMHNAPLAPGDLATWSGFWDHVLARGFGGDMFAFANRTDLALRLPLLPTLFRMQFPPAFLVGIALSWLWLARRHRRLAAALLVSWLVHTYVTLTYRAPQTVEYLMPAYLPMVVAFGLGVAAIIQGATRTTQHAVRRIRDAACVAILIALLARFPLHVPDFALLAADSSIRERTAPLLEAAPPDALILADWRWATPLWVLQQVEGVRPDVEVRYVYPVEGLDYEAVWHTHADEADERPVLTTHNYTWDGWTSAPVGGGFRLYRRPLTTLPPELGFTPLVSDLGAIQLVGYRLVGDLRPGRHVELQLAWRAVGPQDPPPSFTARLWDADGGLLVQADRYLGSATAQGETRFTHLTLQLPADRCSNVVDPTVGVYTVQDGAFQDLGSVSLPERTMRCRFPTLPTQHPWPGFVVGGPFLRGIDYDVSDTSATAYLHWCGPGQAMMVQSGESRALVNPLGPGRCQTVRVAVPIGQRPHLTLTRIDGSPARMFALPLPAPEPGDRYIPLGDEMVLVGSQMVQRGGQLVLDLNWRTARPIVDDYAVSVRLLGEDGQLGMHDMQPGLGALPTLKWVVRDGRILDPHPFSPPATTPTGVALTVYERFRMTPLPSPAGEVTTYPLP